MLSVLLILASLAPGAAKAPKKPTLVVTCVERADRGLRFNGALEAALSKRLRKGPVRVAKTPRRKFSPDDALEPATLLQLGRRVKGNIVIATSLQRSTSSGASGVTARGFGRIVALDVAAGEKLGEFASSQSAKGANASKARDALYRAWVDDVADLVERKAIPAWSRQTERGTSFRVVVDGTSKSSRVGFLKLLKRAPRVVSVRTLSEVDKRISVEVRYRGSAEQLVRTIFQKARRRRPLRKLTRVGRGVEPIALELP
ncbi:MAG: hypothetical protein AAF735_00685 [Myxococcota bacterium]